MQRHCFCQRKGGLVKRGKNFCHGPFLYLFSKAMMISLFCLFVCLLLTCQVQSHPALNTYKIQTFEYAKHPESFTHITNIFRLKKLLHSHQKNAVIFKRFDSFCKVLTHWSQICIMHCQFCSVIRSRFLVTLESKTSTTMRVHIFYRKPAQHLQLAESIASQYHCQYVESPLIIPHVCSIMQNYIIKQRTHCANHESSALHQSRMSEMTSSLI